MIYVMKIIYNITYIIIVTILIKMIVYSLNILIIYKKYYHKEFQNIILFIIKDLE
jgi:hypothetical protein